MNELSKKIKLALLEKLMDAMDEKESEKLSSLKKKDEPKAGMAIIEIEKKPSPEVEEEELEKAMEDEEEGSAEEELLKKLKKLK